MIDDDEYVAVQIETGIGDAPSGRRLASLGAFARAELIDPMIERLHDLMPEPRATRTGRTSQLTVEANAWSQDQPSDRRSDSPREWDRILAFAESGRADSLMIDVSLRGVGAPTLVANLQFAPEWPSNTYYAFWFSALWRYVPYLDQRSLVQTVVHVAREMKALAGSITLDRTIDLTAHEIDIGRGRTDFLDLHSRVRGYQWGTLLSGGHLQALGGLERVAETAPVFNVTAVGGGSSPDLAFLQLTPDLRSVTDRDLADLKRFLAPVLAEPATEAEPYFGPPVRAVHLPGEIDRRSGDASQGAVPSDAEMAERISHLEEQLQAHGLLSANANANANARPGSRRGGRPPVTLELDANDASQRLTIVLSLAHRMSASERERLTMILERPGDNPSTIRVVEVEESAESNTVECLLDTSRAAETDILRLVDALAAFGPPIERIDVGI